MDETILLRRLEDLARQAQGQGMPKFSDFLDPREQNLAVQWAKAVGIDYDLDGGYVEAERKICLFLPPGLKKGQIPVPLVALGIYPDEKKGKGDLVHRDYLGALLALGVRRDKVGDILVDKLSAQVIVHHDIARFLLLQLREVGSLGVAVEQIPLEELKPPSTDWREIRTTLASIRLDAVLAAAFGMSRKNAVELVEAERVQVNWRPVTGPAKRVQAGDVISVRGRGRAKVLRLEGESKKGRLRVVIGRAN